MRLFRHRELHVSARSALVTGASQRIGAVIAEGLAASGYSLHLHCRRSLEELDALAQRLRREYGCPVQTHSADFDLLDQVEDLVKLVRAADSPPTLVVNNASRFEDTDTPQEGLDIARLEAYVRINALAPIALANVFLPDRSGHIVNVVDAGLGERDSAKLYYQMSKSLLEQATLHLASALGPSVRVNAVAPGPVLPPPGKDDAYLMEKVAPLPLPALIDPADIADAIIYLEGAKSVTGGMIYLDGGQHL